MVGTVFVDSENSKVMLKMEMITMILRMMTTIPQQAGG